MNNGNLSLEKATRFVPRSYYESLSADKRARRGDILLSVTGSLGIAAPVATDEPFVFQRHIAVLRPDRQAVDGRFLLHFLRSAKTRERLVEGSTGTAQMTIALGPLRRFQIPLPPLAEQRRIVTRIEALFARTRRARADLERIAPLGDKYLAATFKKAFQGLLTEGWRLKNLRVVEPGYDGGPEGPYELPSSWRWQYLPSLGELARGKSRHRPRNAAVLYGGPYPFVQTGDVRAAQGRLRTYEQTYSEAGLAQSRLWPPDTVCITIAANIAETAILDIEACFPDSVVGFQVKQNICLSEFIEYFIRTAKADLAAFAPATAQKNINLETLEAVLVPTPSLEEQRECVRLLSRSEMAAEASRRQASRAVGLLNRLEQSILARAFRGELVAQDPADIADPAAARHALPASRPRARTLA